MGLFDIFEKKDSTIENHSSDYLSLDLNSLLKKAAVYKRHEDENGFNSMEYECMLDTHFLKTFDRLAVKKKK